jgi:geranylgeranyl pyrophosphate synthase
MKKSEASKGGLQTQFRDDLNKYLGDYYKRRTAMASTQSPDFEQLWQNLSNLHRAGGKRLRPYLSYLTYKAYGGKHYKNFVPIAAAIELVHTAILMHDDVIDQDDFRHGQPNLSGIYKKVYATKAPTAKLASHLALSTAILGGDLLLSDAYFMIQNSGFKHDEQAKASRLVNEAVFYVIGGELLDTIAVIEEFENVDSLLIARLKTAIYSCSVPMAVGGTLAGATEETVNKLREIGIGIGIGFQMADDLLGVFGDTSKTGKTNLGDLREGKRTYLIQTALRSSDSKSKKKLLSYLGKTDLTDKQADKARQLIEASGAKASIEALMQKHAQHALEQVQQLSIASKDKDELSAFIKTAIWRNT